nr:uncharacterized protein LOC102450220 isoform X2 [Pelodiscus sinensis]|eukprot:XP_025035950.1 uncharacterized protein LOC102450220 isoform X2 [Pelodiscus sinensis]
MEDEEGYTSLHLRPKVRTADRSRQPETQDHPPCPCWHRLALRLGAAWFLVQVASVILTGIWVFQPRRCLNCLENNSTGERLIPQCNGSPGLTDFQSRLKQFVCESSPSNSADFHSNEFQRHKRGLAWTNQYIPHKELDLDGRLPVKYNTVQGSTSP